MKKKDRELVADVVENEGFGYTFMHKDSFEEIKDKRFHELRLAFKKAAKELAEYVGLEEY